MLEVCILEVNMLVGGILGAGNLLVGILVVDTGWLMKVEGRQWYIVAAGSG